MSIKNWIAVSIVTVAIVAEIVLVFLNPVAAIFSGAGFILGGVTGYLLKKEGIVNSTLTESFIVEETPKVKEVKTTTPVVKRHARKSSKVEE